MAVTLVTGPPCSGKSTFVADLRSPEDLVLDHDVMARAKGSTRKWNHSKVANRRASAAMNAAISMVPTITDRDVYVIRCVADAGQRQALATYIKADRVVVLLPPVDVLMDRADERPFSGITKAAINKWLNSYSPLDADEVITVARSKGHTGRPWRRVRAQVLATSTVCHLCGRDGADSVDHLIPVSLGGPPLDPANLRPAHISCNSRKGNRLHSRQAPLNASREW